MTLKRKMINIITDCIDLMAFIDLRESEEQIETLKMTISKLKEVDNSMFLKDNSEIWGLLYIKVAIFWVNWAIKNPYSTRKGCIIEIDKSLSFALSELINEYANDRRD